MPKSTTNRRLQKISKLIVKSFKGCGLTNALDGSDDDKIHCFKPDASIPTGLDLLQETRINRGLERMADLMEEIDLDEDENNGHEGDEDEIDFDTQ
jgi:hypothetical protein